MHDLNVYICLIKNFFLSFFFFRDETHKVDVINFAQSKAAQCFKNENLIDKESASLLWDFIVLLCRQNGVCLSAGVFICPKVFCTQIVFCAEIWNLCSSH